MISLVLALTSGAWAAPCSAPASADMLARVVGIAEQAVEVGRAEAPVAALLRGLPCASEVLPARLVARIHRVLGLHALRKGRSTLAIQALTAARTLDPSLQPPLPPEGPLALAWALAPARPPATLSLKPPKDALVVLDGLPSIWMPQDRPVLVQLVVDEVHPVLTAWLKPGAPLPALPREAGTRPPPAAPQPAGGNSSHDGT